MINKNKTHSRIHCTTISQPNR